MDGPSPSTRHEGGEYAVVEEFGGVEDMFVHTGVEPCRSILVLPGMFFGVKGLHALDILCHFLAHRHRVELRPSIFLLIFRRAPLQLAVANAALKTLRGIFMRLLNATQDRGHF